MWITIVQLISFSLVDRFFFYFCRAPCSAVGLEHLCSDSYPPWQRIDANDRSMMRSSIDLYDFDDEAADDFDLDSLLTLI